ncbi:hypothetical protein HKX48_007976 [Thoreauomyces humboldtii]|nr:hypothetical protein HKX48_007976 [Thoreauomyces humboldtii]
MGEAARQDEEFGLGEHIVKTWCGGKLKGKEVASPLPQLPTGNLNLHLVQQSNNGIYHLGNIATIKTSVNDMTPAKTSILITGATGYIGGSVLNRLLSHPDRASFDITALTRDAAKGKTFKEKFNVQPLVGSHSDLDTLQKAAEQADVVFSCADADALDAVKAILTGLKNRHAKTGTAPTLIHTSGTGVITDKAAGEYPGEEIYSDLDVAHIERIPNNAPHREIDMAVVAADTAGYVKTHIVLPSTIYGVATGPVYEAGLANAHSVQIPLAIRASIARRQAGMVGKGLNLWPNVHIDDVADLYLVIFDAVRTHPEKVGHGREGFYFAENGQYALIDSTRQIGRVLHELKLADTAEPSAFSEEEIKKFLGGSKYLGSNSRCKSDRGRGLGWTPVKTTEDLIKSIEPEIKELVRTGNTKLPEVLRDAY